VQNFVGSKEMRDLTVDVIHTYYVFAAQAPVLVHNCKGGYDGDGNKCTCGKLEPRPLGPVAHVYRGGVYGDDAKMRVKTSGGWRNPTGIEIHHLPPDSTQNMPRGDGFAIQMDRADHEKLWSTGGRPNSKQARWREMQADLISKGDWAGAMQNEINDIRSKFGTKYDDAIEEMLSGIGLP
jgi:hypothetical protein